MTDAPPYSPTAGRSLVVIEAVGPRELPSAATGRADAAFLAHLLAVRNRMPAQRSRCRAEPEAGASAYRTGLALLSTGIDPRVRLRA